MREVSDVERRARVARRHALAPGHRAAGPEAATDALTVLHATEAPTVYLSLWARVDGLTTADVDRALYDDRTLVKQLAMRRTLFVFPRDLLPAAWGSASARVARAHRVRLIKDAEAGGLAADGEDLRAAYRLAAALESVADRHNLDCGTFNSHLEYSHNNPKIGLVGGRANSWLTSAGIPFTDTGDTITAMAMLVGRLLSGTAVYTELNTIDYDAGAILCANTGEVDFSAASHVSIFPAKSFTGKQQRGAIIDAELRTGPATILGFTPHPDARGGFRLIVFPGHVTGRPNIDLHVPHSLFRPAGLDAPTGFSRWIEAGATHHACLSLGDIVEPARLVGNLLGIDVEVIA